jgi:hypothetical protein
LAFHGTFVESHVVEGTSRWNSFVTSHGREESPSVSHGREEVFGATQIRKPFENA